MLVDLGLDARLALQRDAGQVLAVGPQGLLACDSSLADALAGASRTCSSRRFLLVATSATPRRTCVSSSVCFSKPRSSISLGSSAASSALLAFAWKIAFRRLKKHIVTPCRGGSRPAETTQPRPPGGRAAAGLAVAPGGCDPGVRVHLPGRLAVVILALRRGPRDRGARPRRGAAVAAHPTDVAVESGAPVSGGDRADLERSADELAARRHARRSTSCWPRGRPTRTGYARQVRQAVGYRGDMLVLSPSNLRIDSRLPTSAEQAAFESEMRRAAGRPGPGHDRRGRAPVERDARRQRRLGGPSSGRRRRGQQRRRGRARDHRRPDRGGRRRGHLPQQARPEAPPGAERRGRPAPSSTRWSTAWPRRSPTSTRTWRCGGERAVAAKEDYEAAALAYGEAREAAGPAQPDSGPGRPGRRPAGEGPARGAAHARPLGGPARSRRPTRSRCSRASAPSIPSTARP